MNLTDKERQIVDDAERQKGRPLPRIPLIIYVSMVLMVGAGILGLWERENVPQYLLLIGFAVLLFGFFKLQYRYYLAMGLIAKLQSPVE